MRGPTPVLTLLVLLLAGPAVAQERPPGAGPVRAQSALTGIRPPERPAEEAKASEETTASPPKPEQAGVPETEEAAAPPAEAFGPPAPPAWYAARESDEDFAACRLALAMLGTVYENRPAVTNPDNPDCGIARPIRVQRILPDLILEGGAEMRCDTARALGLWARDFARPAAATLPGAPRLTGLRLGSTYACRARVGTGQARPKLSEHALGNAIDISAFLFDGAGTLPVQPRRDSGDQAEAFQRTVRGAACLFFTTVLGPGVNKAHAEHLHFDIAARRGDWRLCQ